MTALSICCNAPLRVASSGEGTNYYVCTKCENPTSERETGKEANLNPDQDFPDKATLSPAGAVASAKNQHADEQARGVSESGKVELLPCHFCGLGPVLLPDSNSHWVICQNCGSRASSLTTWNRRAPCSKCAELERQHESDARQLKVQCEQIGSYEFERRQLERQLEGAVGAIAGLSVSLAEEKRRREEAEVLLKASRAGQPLGPLIGAMTIAIKEKQLEAARLALAKFGSHKQNCHYWDSFPCSCGLGEAIATLAAPHGEVGEPDPSRPGYQRAVKGEK